MMEASCSRFTAAEGGARLAAAAGERNVLTVEYASFIATRLVHEDAYKIRGSMFEGRQRSVYVTRAARVPCVTYELRIMTDLRVTSAAEYSDVYDWTAEMDKHEVLVCTSSVLHQVLEEEVLTMSNINVLIIDSCHMVWRDRGLQFIMKLYKQTEENSRPRILAITYPLFSSPKKETDNNQKTNTLSANEKDIEEEKKEEFKEECKKDDSGKFEEDNLVKEETREVEKKISDVQEVGVYENLDDYEMYEKLEWKIEELEKELCCQMDLAEDIDGGKRLSGTLTKPKELIIEYGAAPSPGTLPEPYVRLDAYMRDAVRDAEHFINEHRYDPTEIYGEDLYEEFKNIPDPTIEPKHIFKQFLYVLDQLGPYAADKAAFSLLAKLEKLKIKVPYERHFLLLCLCTTVFVKIRCYADTVFTECSSDWEKIKLFSTPKVLRLAEILQKFSPPELQRKPSDNTAKMLKDLEKCDFASLGDKIEDKVNTFAANLKDLDEVSAGDKGDCEIKGDGGENRSDSGENKCDSAEIKCDSGENKCDSTENKCDSGENKCDSAGNKSDVVQNVGFGRRPGGRTRGRGRAPRTQTARALAAQQHPDALCGIVFMREALMAKILFMLIVDMSRAHPPLSYLSAQYCAVETPADPGTEPRECQRQGKKQEEVLKKFRMHECNLLLATSALEEGIDLPRCNLVLRWDVPASYRSYGLCRGRARAARAACAVLSCGDGPSTGDLLHNLATYRRLDQIISKKCGCGIQDEPPESEENEADVYTLAVKPYTPHENTAKDEKTTKHDAKTNKSDAKTTKRGTKTTKNRTDSDKSEKTLELCSEKSFDSNNIENKNGLTNDFNNLKLSDSLNSQNEAKNIENQLNSVENVTDSLCENDNDSKLSENMFDSIKSDNLVCNRCNNLKNSMSVECCCLNIANVSDSKNKVDSAGDRDSKKVQSELASVDLSTAIALINRYCGKLPSDTFTRLAPQWWMEEVRLPVHGSTQTRTAYVCTLRLPLNCPVKYNIVGHPMPTRVLARRMVALQACRILHKSGELDNQLMPIGKENFKAAELEGGVQGSGAGAGAAGEGGEPGDARPGTTKRRQYYFKRTAWAFTDCQPIVDAADSDIDPPGELPALTDTAAAANTEPDSKVVTGTKRNMLYAIVSKLWCALPERYNTRGRRLHAPQNASQAIGILMARDRADDLQIPAFPVYTRSGEVRVSVEYVPDADVRMSPRRGRLIRRFMRFVFAEVLRVRRRGMKLHPDASAANNYYIVPTVKSTREDGTTKIDIDWPFLELIYQHTEERKLAEPERPLWGHDDECPNDDKVEKEKEKDGKVKKMENPLLKPGEVFVFDAEKYKEAVVTPWYRNQDQPQFFLVAEICWNLSPDSAFPSATHTSFRNYYQNKYGVELTQSEQPLLDVDHTSARLNLLTPRYVNRKGVALPVSSERTRRAKRDRLDQKQILVPELCRRHPFQAPLWFATVALPCVLYRINALLIADEIRRAVAIDVGLGIPKIDETTCPGFKWPPLDFGWSLAEVLSADSDKNEKKKEDDDTQKEEKETKEKEQKEKKEEEEEKEVIADEKPKEKTINDILAEKEDAENGFEIGTWSNDMASSLPEEYDEYMEPLPSNLTFCTSASGGANWCDPIEKPKSQYQPTRTFSMAESDCSYMSSDFDTDDSDLNSESEEDGESGGLWSKGSMGVRIEYKTAHEAEAVDVERKKKVNPAPQPDEEDDEEDRMLHHECIREGQAPAEYIEKFRSSVAHHKKEIVEDKNLIKKDQPITDVLPESKEEKPQLTNKPTEDVLKDLFPYFDGELKTADGQITLESIEKNKRVLLQKLKNSMPDEEVRKLNCFSMVDVDIDSPDYVNEKVANVGFDTKDSYADKVREWGCSGGGGLPYYMEGGGRGKDFDFDYQPTLDGHPGPSPSVILQALTMSNANDGINLERLETIGDSFLKFAITAYLYCAHPAVHEGKLSHMRSKQVSNLNLYRLGRGRRLGARMIASKFEPHDNWLPPCHKPPHSHPRGEGQEQAVTAEVAVDSSGCFIPYNLITQHSIPDKSIADCVEALIGAYLLECGPRGALLFMSWLGIRVLPRHDLSLPPDHPYVLAAGMEDRKPKPQSSFKPSYQDVTDSDTECSSEDDEPWPQEEELAGEEDWSWPGRPVGSLRPYRNEDGTWMQPIFGCLRAPPSPLLRYIANPEGELEQMLSGYDELERTLQYRFKDRSLLLQALTHASHQKNRLTDCYQRLEFLGDAILDYLITRHLYEDKRRHSPGALTDLRSALVNNTIFATLAARHGFHKYFRHMSPGLNEVLTKYVKIQEENGHSISEEHYLIQEDELEQAEDVEVPKALGDLFESVAGAVFLDSGMSLGAVWASYERLMGAELEAFSAAAPKSPVRELLEAEPDTAKFGKPERLADGRRVRVCVEVFGRGAFKGVGRNYRIAKGTAARCALRHLRSQHR